MLLQSNYTTDGWVMCVLIYYITLTSANVVCIVKNWKLNFDEKFYNGNCNLCTNVFFASFHFVYISSYNKLCRFICCYVFIIFSSTVFNSFHLFYFILLLLAFLFKGKHRSYNFSHIKKKSVCKNQTWFHAFILIIEKCYW